MRFFLDNTLSPAIARSLHSLCEPDGHEVFHLKDKFPPDTDDIDWIGSLAEDGDWVIITSDRRIRKNSHERQALIDSGQTVLFLAKAWSSYKLWTQAWKLVKAWPDFISALKTVVSGSAFEVKANGKLDPIPLN